MNKWVERNKERFGVQIIELKKIIERQVIDSGSSDEFASDMYVALISGRKITPKMEAAIDRIIKAHSPDELLKREEWVNKVVPKLLMVENLIDDTSWTEDYKVNTKRFISSLAKQAKSRKTLSKKQMDSAANVYARVKKNLFGKKISFSNISVGATENLIMAASLAKGTTILKNCATEPEIKDLINFLNKAGTKIKWIGKRSIKINGVKSLKSVKYKVMGDRIECGTFCVAAVLTSGKLQIKGFDPKLIYTELDLLKKIGAKIKVGINEINIEGYKKLKNIKNLVTKEYPYFPTDLQAQFMVLLSKANGISRITENIFENRFLHVGELRRLGAKINVKNNQAIIEGNNDFQGAELMSSDLRASVALVLAALISKGKSTINRIYHLDRGYENLEKKLKKIGVKINRVN